MPDDPLDAQQRAALKQVLSLPVTTLYGLGNILGAGIYVLIGKIVLYAGGFTLVAFLLAAGLAALTAFAYAELSARFPLSAGAAVYVHEGTGSRVAGLLVGVLIVTVGVVSSAAILRGFSGYLQVFITVPVNIVLCIAVVLLGGLAAWGINQSARVAAVATLIEISGLLLIIAVAAPGALRTDFELASVAAGGGFQVWQGVLLAAFFAFFAFTGFEDMVNVAEEVQRPERNLPRAIALALVIATCLYLGVALVALANVTPDDLGGSDAPLALVYETVTGRDPVLITVIGLFAVINGALVQIIMASRVLYGMARRGWLPVRLGRVHPTTRTPLAATLLVSLLILGMALWLPIETLAKATSYVLLLIFSLVNLSLWRLKRQAAQPSGIIRVPQWVPVVGLFASVAFVVVQAASDLTGQ